MKSLVFTLLMLGSWQLFAQSYSFDARLTAYDKSADEFYGTEVDITGTLMIVGAPDDGISTGPNGGSAYVYEEIGGSWTLAAKLRPNDSLMSVNFGTSVAISASFAVVGDPNEGGSGAAYIFERDGSNWTQIDRLEATVPTMGDEFGHSIELDGDWLFVGAPNEEENASELEPVAGGGSIFVYQYDGANWNFDHKMVPSDRLEAEGTNQRFGFSLAADQGKLIVGAYQRFDSTLFDVGAVYFFEEVAGSWEEKILLRPGDGASADFFGWEVDLKGTTAIVGALNHDYDLAGGDFKGESGAAYYYTYDNNNWVAGGKLIWSERDNGDFFGSSVAITPNEEFIIVGMYEDNVRLEFDGEVYNKSECGAAVLFQRQMDGSYAEEARITPSIIATGDHFGQAMAATNTTLVIAADQDDIETFPNEGLCNLDSIADNGAVDVFSLMGTTSLESTIASPPLQVYPNPSRNVVQITSHQREASIELLSLDGRSLKRYPMDRRLQIDLSDLPTGFYLLRTKQGRTVSLVKN